MRQWTMSSLVQVMACHLGITLTNTNLLSTGPLGTKFSEKSSILWFKFHRLLSLQGPKINKSAFGSGNDLAEQAICQYLIYYQIIEHGFSNC